MNLDLEGSLPTSSDLIAYLRLRGWRREEGGRNASIWSNREVDGELASVLVPHVETASDYADRVAMLLGQLSKVQRQSIETVRRDASLVYFDVVPIRASDESVIDDSIPLQAGLDLYSSARKMVIAAAGATIRRASHFGRTLPFSARGHARIVRVGQTQRGSYIVPIISRARSSLEETSPVPEQHLDIDVEESLFDRRVMNTMATALDTLQEIVGTLAPSNRQLSHAVSAGVTRELCVGVLNAVRSHAISALSIAFEWAPASSRPRGAPRIVEFSREAATPLASVADRLRVLDVPKEDIIFGLVTDLRHRSSDPGRRVVVEAMVDKRIRMVYMSLTPEQYEIAQECHERTKVMVRGRLRAPFGGRAEMEVDYFGPDASLFDIGVDGVETTPQ